MFDFDEWKGKRVVMHCKTPEEAEAFCKEMDEAGLTWSYGERYTDENFWHKDKESTCYCFNKGVRVHIDYAREQKYTVLEYSGYMSKPKNYETSIKEMISYCESILIEKHREYATDDDFHNFNVAAELQNVTPLQALLGMMDKHVVSVHDMVAEHAEGREITLALWEEKICDNINYLLILWAMVNQEGA